MPIAPESGPENSSRAAGAAGAALKRMAIQQHRYRHHQTLCGRVECRRQCRYGDVAFQCGKGVGAPRARHPAAQR